MKRLSVAPGSMAVTAWVPASIMLKGRLCRGRPARNQELPSAVKAGVSISIYFICKFTPTVNSLLKGRTVVCQTLTIGNLVCPTSRFRCSLPLALVGWGDTSIVSDIRQYRVSDDSSSPLSSAFFHVWMEPCDSLTASHKEAEPPDGLV